MKLDRTLARRLSTASELELLQSSTGTALKELSERRLRATIARARRLRDKQRDLLRRQRLASRARTGTKHGARPGSNARTAQKVQLFEDALARFEERLGALKKPARARPRKKPAGRVQSRGPATRPRASGKPPKAGPRALLQKARSPRTKAIQAHVKSRGRRAQARRDARR
jgi:hypothetical protein